MWFLEFLEYPGNLKSPPKTSANLVFFLRKLANSLGFVIKAVFIVRRGVR